MSIENNWNQISQAPDDDLSSLLRAPRLSRFSSNNPLEKIKKNTLLNMIWGGLVCLFYVGIIGYFQIWQVQIAIFIVLLFSLWAVYTAYRQYQQLNSQVSASNPVLQELKRHHQSISNWMKTQQRVALFIYPISAAGGFMLGGVMGSGKPVEVFMGKPFVQLALLISIVILVPACYYLARWMFQQSFGKHLAALQENITELEAEK
jgi:ABC-type sugar transport system permease subunit